MWRWQNPVFGVVGAALGLALLGCNGTVGNGSDSTTSANSSPTGIWTGTDSVSGLSITGIINATGNADFIRSDGAQFVGVAQMSGTTIAITIDGYSNFGSGSTFSDGSSHGLGTLNGTVATATSITATLNFTTNAGTAMNGSWTLSFDPLSNTGSSLQTISGTYTDGTTGATLSINALGILSSQDPSNGCVLTGTVSTADSTQDIYEIGYTYTECTGTYAALNGLSLTGLAVLNSNQSPPQIIVGVSGQSSTANYAIASFLNGD